jgi:hypothetical protein
MDEKNQNQYNLLEQKFKKIRKELFEEWKIKYPSYHLLERSASEIQTLLKKSNIEDEEFKIWASWAKLKLDIFIADLVGTLEHDYEKGLDRYYNKWSKEKGKIDTLVSDFKTKFSDKIE